MARNMMSYEERLEKSRQYYRDHREERLRYNRIYYMQRKLYLQNYNQKRWRKIREARLKTMRDYWARNQEQYAEEQKIIREARLARGWSQKKLGEKVGVTAGCISHYEFGRVKAPWDKLYVVMPELKEARENEKETHRD